MLFWIMNLNFVYDLKLNVYYYDNLWYSLITVFVCTLDNFSLSNADTLELSTYYYLYFSNFDYLKSICFVVSTISRSTIIR
jgi:hypothetical protein